MNKKTKEKEKKRVEPLICLKGCDVRTEKVFFEASVEGRLSSPAILMSDKVMYS